MPKKPSKPPAKLPTPALPPIRSTAALAAHLGLSRWTVSRALNGHSGVDPATREKVREAMARSGFAPSPAARLLRGGRTGTVGVCLQEIDNLNLAPKISALHAGLRDAGFRALLELSDGRPGAEEEILRHFAAMRVEGVVLFAGTLPPGNAAFAALRAAGIPVVPVDPRDLSLPGAVSADRPAAIRLAARHLLGLGHRRFAALGIDPAYYYGKLRAGALREALRPSKAALSFIHEPGAERMDFEYGARLADRVSALPKAERPTALISLNDRLAVGAAARLRALGLGVPRDFSVVGYDNADVGACASPPLTTVDPGADALVSAALERLLRRMGGKRDASGSWLSPLRIEPRLVVRASTAAPARSRGPLICATAPEPVPRETSGSPVPPRPAR